MKWDYKIISVDTLFHSSNDHDIAVSKDAASTRRTTMGQGIEQTLNELGKDSWELVSIIGEFGVFKKPAK
jgi:hypothetical protein